MMLSYENCPDGLPCMPSWPTINGRPFPNSKSVFMLTSEDPVDYIRCAPELENFIAFNERRDWKSDPIEVEKYSRQYSESRVSYAAPTLVSIGLLDALLEVEAVLAWNQTEKHPGAKWKSKSIDWHDSKAVSHLSKAQNESLKDDETGRSHRAHAACRLLMSLAHELNKNNI